MSFFSLYSARLSFSVALSVSYPTLTQRVKRGMK